MWPHIRVRVSCWPYSRPPLNGCHFRLKEDDAQPACCGGHHSGPGERSEEMLSGWANPIRRDTSEVRKSSTSQPIDVWLLRMRRQESEQGSWQGVRCSSPPHPIVRTNSTMRTGLSRPSIESMPHWTDRPHRPLRSTSEHAVTRSIAPLVPSEDPRWGVVCCGRRGEALQQKT